MALPTAGKCIEQHLPIVKQQGLNTLKASNLAGFLVDASGNVTVPGTLAVTGAQTFTGDQAITGALTVGTTLGVTGASTLTGAVNYKRQVTNTGGAYATPIALTVAQSGRVLLVNDAAGLDFTLPAVGAGDVGTHFKFVVTVTVSSNNFRVTAASGDLLFGGLAYHDFDTADKTQFFAPDGNDLIMTMNGSTTGGKQGTWVEFICSSATQWLVTGVVAADGTMATPFS